MKGLAPIALFVYNRPEHTRRCLEALSANFLASDSVLHIFSDGPKADATATDIVRINEVRELIREKNWCGTVHIHESSINKGLFDSITQGIRFVLEKSDRIIIVEDDILTFPDFLSYCNKGLDKYEQEEKVWLLSGYMFPIGSEENLPQTFFLPTLSCWGWCTWKRAWLKFNPDAYGQLKKITDSGSKRAFDLNSSYPYFEMLKQRSEGKNQSWDVCWYASFFLGNGLCLYPGNTLAENIGMDGSGTHWIGSGWKSRAQQENIVLTWEFPPSTEPDLSIQHRLEKKLRKEFYPGIKERIIRKLKIIFS